MTGQWHSTDLFFLYVVLVSLLLIFTPTQNEPNLCSIVLLYRGCFVSLLPHMHMLLLFLTDVFASVSFLFSGRFCKPGQSLKLQYLRPTLY